MRNFTSLFRKGGLTVCLIHLFILATTGDLAAQVSLTANDPTLKQVIDAVQSQSDYRFFYESDLAAIRVNPVHVSGVSVDSLLKTALSGTAIAYKIEDRVIYLSRNANPHPAQNARNVTGTVTDANGDPLIGITVVVQNTSVGTTTDLNGRYAISVAGNDDQLVFSYLGFTPVVVAPGNRTVVDVVMTENTITMDNLVVTAMGIRREEKSLTYNVQTIPADEFQTVKDANLMNSLAGKLAGVTISQSSTGVGGSSRVIMRGTKSLFGNNNALYVIDGIPLSDMKSTQSANYYEGEIEGDNEGIAMINPDDIETMSVLTGAAAAALYGNRGSNGVILISTKKGHAGGTRVSLSSNTTFSEPFVLPEFQNTYGRSGETYYSWGEKLGTPSDYRPADFFQTGFNTMNTVAVSTGGDDHQLYASLGAVNSRGIIPNQRYNRYNFRIRSTSTLVKDKLDLDLNAYYTDQDDQNKIAHGLYHNPLVAVYLFPPGDDIERYVPYKIWNPERNFQTQNWVYDREYLEGVIQNPFWTANRDMANNQRERIMVSGALTYRIFDWMSLMLRARVDRGNTESTRKLYASSNILFAHSEQGFYGEQQRKDQNVYADWLLNIDKKIGSVWSLNANLGGSFNDVTYDCRGMSGHLTKVPDYFNVSNMKIENSIRSKSHTRTNALYGTIQIGFKSMLYADFTSRIDYFSTLKSAQGQMILDPYAFYPSVGLSAVLTEILPKNKVLTFWKIRASRSEVGNPPPAYLLDNYARLNNNALEASAFPMTRLSPERTKAFEAGTDIRLWQNKINIAFTYYNTDTYFQLFHVELPPSTGYNYMYENAGKVNNTGIELTVGLNQRIGPVEWQATVAYSRNRNRIEELLGDWVEDPVSGEMMKAPPTFEVSSNMGRSYQMLLSKGGTMSDIYVNSLKLDNAGFVYVHPVSGAFAVDTKNAFKIGEAAPKYNLSVRNHFAWNGLSLGFMVDARVGGVVVSSTQALMDQFGVSRTTAEARDQGGIDFNLGRIDPQTYYQVIAAGKSGAALSEYTYSATNVRLREMSFGYTLPARWFRDKLDLTLSVIGRNLWMFYNKAPYDPEITSNTDTYNQGYDYFMTPSVRSLGFGVNVSF